MALLGKHNITKMYSTTTGTGTLTLTTAVPGCLTFDLGGVVTSEVVPYTIRDGSNTEVGIGTYTTSGTTLSRDTVRSSTNGGAKIVCTGRESVEISLHAEDIQPFSVYYSNVNTSVTNNTDANVITLDTEWLDFSGITSLATNAVTILKKGYYQAVLRVFYSSATATAFNGLVNVSWSGYNLQQGYTTAMGIASNYAYIGPILIYNSADNSSFGTVTIDAHAGSNLTVYVDELSFQKWNSA